MHTIDLHTCAFYSDLYHNRAMKTQEKIAYLRRLQRHYPKKIRNTEPMQRLLHWLSASSSHQMIAYDDPRYPEALAHSSNPPLILFCAGKLERLSQHGVAIVGSRYATQYGMQVAKTLATALGQIDMSIISGLAYGIDTAAAQGALRTPGHTIAILGNGTDIYYPASNQALQRQIAQDGLVISELWPGTPPHASQFPQRNRIISALSLATCVVEAAYPSGSLITARYALEQNKAVLAVPGSIFQRTHVGTHWLIQQGADLLQHPNDVLRIIAPYTPHCPRSIAQSIMWILLQQPVRLDTLIDQLSLPQHVIQTTLLKLAQHDLVYYHRNHYHSSNNYRKVKKSHANRL